MIRLHFVKKMVSKKLAYPTNHLKNVLDRSLAKFQNWTAMINLTLFLRSLKGRCYNNQLIFGANRRHCHTPLSFCVVEFHNALDNWNIFSDD